MADDKQYIINEAPADNVVEVSLPHGFSQGKGVEDGASFHLEATPRGFKLVRDDRPV